MRFVRLITLAHLWLGLLLGVQVILWMASGAVMSFFDIGLVRGETQAAAEIPKELPVRSYANPGGPLAQTPGAVGLRLKFFLNRPVYEVRSGDGYRLFDAQSGEEVSPITEEQAREVARRDFVGDGAVKTVRLLNDPPHEYRREVPVWQVTFTDDLETRLYISPETGEVAARRNKIWRFYDFFWMLHIMDYEGRTNFNNPLLRVFAATGLLFALTGLCLVVIRFRTPQAWLWRRRKSSRGAVAD